MFSKRLVPILALLVLTLAGLSHTATANPQTVGLFQNDPGSFNGYTLFAPIDDTTTYLIDNEGRQVHSWDSSYLPGLTAYLLDDGSLLRTIVEQNSTFNAGGGGGGVQRLDWDGNVEWQFDYNDSQHRQHHDAIMLPNGDVLMIAWEYKTNQEAIDAGRDPSLLTQGVLWPDEIVEVQPTPPTGGNIVWEWHAWDHLVQDFDASKANYGDVAGHPELMDVNFVADSHGSADWLHANSIDYNPALDQILISFRQTSEIWVIDHSTTTAEAASHTGGNSGHGGDILYRWGNPAAYRAGTASDRTLFGQHNAHWITPGLPGAGDILLFNNGNTRTGGNYSSADEIVPPPVDLSGNYEYTPGAAYGPAAPVWTYALPVSLYSAFISGADRLPNGNTLVDSGLFGTFVEVTSAGEVVWKYVDPVAGEGPIEQGQPIPGGIGNAVFRAPRYAPDYPGLSGHDLTPGGPIEIVDADNDGIPSLTELKVYGTDPHVADTDGDGCNDGMEIGIDPVHGGARSPLNPYDYFNPTHDGKNRVDDILLVVGQYLKDDNDGNPGSPPYAPGYNPDTDRTLVGPGLLDLGPPNGMERVNDILNIVQQYYNDCS